MKKMSRRRFLRYGALGGAGLLLAGAGAGVASQTVFEETVATPMPVDRFRAALPIPPVLRPVRTDETTDYDEVVQR